MNTLFQNVEEEKMWDLYCSSITIRSFSEDNRTFDEWRRGDDPNKPKETETMNEEDILTTAQKSNDILKNYSPIKKERG